MTSKITIGESRTAFATGAEGHANRRHRCRRTAWLQSACLLAGLWLCGLAGSSRAQTNSSTPVYPGNRYLVAVETSRAMQRHTNALAQVVRQLVGTAIASQAHGGDTLGFWTYNEEVYTGGLPLQKMSTATPDAISQRITGFLAAQKFEKLGRLDKVIPALDRLNTNSQFITVIVIFRGDKDIQGTPFDAAINQSLRTWRLKEPEAGVPFVLALRGQAGTFVDFKLNPSPWQPELPALPKELLTPLTPTPPVVVATNKPPPAVVPSLIISGRKREATPISPSVETATAPPVVAPSPLAGQTGNTGPGIKPASDQTSPASAPGADSGSSPKAATTPNAAAPLSPTNAAIVVENTAKSGPKLVQPAETAASSVKATEQPPRTSASGDGSPKLAEAATVAPSPTRRLALVVTGVVSLLAMLGALILWRARPRPASETSIITESLDRRKK